MKKIIQLIFFLSIFYAACFSQPDSAAKNVKAAKRQSVLKITGAIDQSSIEGAEKFVSQHPETLYVLDFSQCTFKKSEKGDEDCWFDLYLGAENIVGVIIPKATKTLFRCVAENLIFVQLPDARFECDSYPLACDSLSFIFIDGKTEPSDELLERLGGYNSAIIKPGMNYLEFQKENGVNLYTDFSSQKNRENELRIPSDIRKIKIEEKEEKDGYKIYKTMEESARVIYEIETGWTENKKLEPLINRMNEFILWNKDRYEKEIVSLWRPYFAPTEFCNSFSIMQNEDFAVAMCSFEYMGYRHSSEIVTFCYDFKNKKIVSLADVTGLRGDELKEVLIEGLDYEFLGEWGAERQMVYENSCWFDSDFYENLPFKFDEKGNVIVWFNEGIIIRYIADSYIPKEKFKRK